ncbi:monocarboxylate transporter 13-like [Lingula anatina]|uniref:Monocarboxylate transporter 13-like n=1 Tax=Lingula anatina TaxID=7574 RepID=A0A1S3K061_LINAN|nr:monocarboxylate transporter 13-like [Lingula anatina]|eukprot:XP_013415661.1 monocarboxylate transporter 13-like [Lingula anatina]
MMIVRSIYRGWIILGIAVILFVLFSGIETAWGTTILCLQQDEDFLNAPLALLGAPLALYYFSHFSVSNFIYKALSRVGHLSLRQVAALGISLMVLGLFLTSFANSAYSVTISYGLISGSGNELFSLSMYLVIARWFPWTHDYHVFTTSALSAILPLGTSIVNNVNAQMCADPSLGWQWAFRLYAAIFGFLGLLLILLFGNPPMTLSENDCSPTNKESNFVHPWSKCSKVTIHGIWSIAIFCKGYSYFLPFVILPKHLTDLGYQENEAEYVMTFLGIMGVVGQTFSSWIGDRLKGNLLLVNLVAASLLTVNNIVAVYWTTLTAAFVYSAVTGLGFGPYNAGYYAINYEIMDGENVDTLFMTMRFSKGIGAAVGPYLAGHVRDVTGSYYVVFISIAACLGLFDLATFFLVCVKKFRKIDSLELMKNSSSAE